MKSKVKFLLCLVFIQLFFTNSKAQGMVSGISGNTVVSQKCKSLASGRIFIETLENGQTFCFQVISESQRTVEIVNNKKVKYNLDEYIIPEVVAHDGVEFIVVSIGEKAFSTASKTIRSITFSKSVHTICDEAFYGCKSLSEIHFQEGLKTIGAKAFGRIESLEELVLPSTLKTIGDKAFIGTSAFLNELKIPSSVKRIGQKAFFNDYYMVRLGYYVGTITELPTFVNVGNCEGYGLSKTSVADYLEYRR